MARASKTQVVLVNYYDEQFIVSAKVGKLMNVYAHLGSWAGDPDDWKDHESFGIPLVPYKREIIAKVIEWAEHQVYLEQVVNPNE